MLFDNFGTDAETKTETPLSIFGREERIEYTGHVAGMDTAAVIRHGQVNAPILDKRLEVNRTGALGRISNGVFCIDDQVQNNLLQTMRIAPDIRQILRKIGCNNDVFNVRLILSQLSDIPNCLVQIECGPLRLCFRSESKEILNDFSRPLCLVQYHVHHPPDGWV